jgi:hypothetical protein
VIEILASEMRGDRVGDYGPAGGIVGFIAIALFFYVLLGGPFRRGGGKR